jgi:hypothetical protein
LFRQFIMPSTKVSAPVISSEPYIPPSIWGAPDDKNEEAQAVLKEKVSAHARHEKRRYLGNHDIGTIGRLCETFDDLGTQMFSLDPGLSISQSEDRRATLVGGGVQARYIFLGKTRVVEPGPELDELEESDESRRLFTSTEGDVYYLDPKLFRSTTEIAGRPVRGALLMNALEACNRPEDANCHVCFYSDFGNRTNPGGAVGELRNCCNYAFSHGNGVKESPLVAYTIVKVLSGETFRFFRPSLVEKRITAAAARSEEEARLAQKRKAEEADCVSEFDPDDVLIGVTPKKRGGSSVKTRLAKREEDLLRDHNVPGIKDAEVEARQVYRAQLASVVEEYEKKVALLLDAFAEERSKHTMILERLAKSFECLSDRVGGGSVTRVRDPNAGSSSFIPLVDPVDDNAIAPPPGLQRFEVGDLTSTPAKVEQPTTKGKSGDDDSSSGDSSSDSSYHSDDSAS